MRYWLGPVLIGAAICGSWGILFSWVPPSDQQFPLMDDWAFSRGAFLFAKTHACRYFDWAAMPQLGQWLWAWPFIRWVGETHVALRISTVMLSWLGLWAFYDLLIQQGCGGGLACLAALALCFNPLCFIMQGTFMTDVPALSFSLVALALYGRALMSGGFLPLLGATAAAVFAVSTRQNTIVVPLVAGALVWRDPLRQRRPMFIAGGAIPIVTWVVVQLWFEGRADAWPARPEVPRPLMLLLIPFVALHLLGLSAIPVLLCTRSGGSRVTYTRAVLLVVGCAAYWKALDWQSQGKTFSFGGLFPYREGALTIHGACAGTVGLGQRPVLIGPAGQLMLTALGCAGAAFLLVRMLRFWRGEQQLTPLALFALFQLPLLLIAPTFFDRYLLFLLPSGLAIAAGEVAPSRLRLGAACAVILMMAVISVVVERDTLTWNSARWKVGRRALDPNFKNLKPWDIAGGLEWDGWYAPTERFRLAVPNQGFQLPLTAAWFPHVSGKMALAFSVGEGQIGVDSEPYRQWLPPGQHRFYLVTLGHADKRLPQTKDLRP